MRTSLVDYKPPAVAAYAVDLAWETDLEPGEWFRIVDASKPRLIKGFVFVPARGPIDYREVDGKKLSARAPETAGLVRAWEGAISVHRGEVKLWHLSTAGS